MRRKRQRLINAGGSCRGRVAGDPHEVFHGAVMRRQHRRSDRPPRVEIASDVGGGVEIDGLISE